MPKVAWDWLFVTYFKIWCLRCDIFSSSNHRLVLLVCHTNLLQLQCCIQWIKIIKQIKCDVIIWLPILFHKDWMFLPRQRVFLLWTHTLARLDVLPPFDKYHPRVEASGVKGAQEQSGSRIGIGWVRFPPRLRPDTEIGRRPPALPDWCREWNHLKFWRRICNCHMSPVIWDCLYFKVLL